MNRNVFNQLIDAASFSELFISEMGWDNPSNKQSVPIDADGLQYDFIPVAEKSGFQVYQCIVDEIPSASLCKTIDNRLRKYSYDYICVFVQKDTSHHLWIAPVKTNEKREVVKTEYDGGAKADFLFSKVDGLSFGITEKVLITDVKSRVQCSFRLNSEEVTKAFYRQFNDQHKSFRKHIKGISDEKNIDWYASVMLNRLMFCYFIQKKGFLNLDTNYLSNKLKWVQEQRGEDKFYGTFYKGFLCALFHDGMNNPRHESPEFLAKYGRIPYLNGGMFDDHQLERENSGIDIEDIAFENLFEFFNRWNWHLDTRLTASGKDINPDVLGYIFEQYINDRAAMGAYYTKEDITEYIGKNCIIPFLMNKVAEKSKDAFKPGHFIWRYFNSSGDKYIYDAVKKGYSPDWQTRIPDYISCGIDTASANLLERRKRWNEKTFDEFALPTEIWRETVDRLQRCDSLLQKISSGEITNINDFITYNLDIRQFAEDILRETDDHRFVLHFYEALQSITVLDPTCGSGAFLFAALNILEPLYEACLDRMEEWHKTNQNLFAEQLKEIGEKYGNNRQYFIYKSIILRNLYGVDIMVEATEIAKLRLFLKMVAVVEVDKRKDNLGLEPLPDVDFNIKCGNTLVGYATEQELMDDLKCAGTINGLSANNIYKNTIQTQLEEISKAFECFRSEQLRTYDDNATIKQTKEALKNKLNSLNDLLNNYMYKRGLGVLSYSDWLKSHQPFHWLAEYYQIIKGNGGFDVVIGNPPYVEYCKKDSKTKKSIADYYKINGYKTEDCGNLYAYVIERSLKIIRNNGKTGMIIPHSSICTDRMLNLYSIFSEKKGWFSTYDTRPSKLFDGVDQRLLIYILGSQKTYTTNYYRWNSKFRPFLFFSIQYGEGLFFNQYVSMTKLSNNIERSILDKILLENKIILESDKYSSNVVYYHGAPRYFTRGITFPPYFYNEQDGEKLSVSVKTIPFSMTSSQKIASSIISSSLFYLWFVVTSDCRHLNSREVYNFPYSFNDTPDFIELMVRLNEELMTDLENNKSRKSTSYKATGQVKYDEYYPKLSKSLIDLIDKALAEHYGFTEEELDFIINYDIKFRMSNESNKEE